MPSRHWSSVNLLGSSALAMAAGACVSTRDLFGENLASMSPISSTSSGSVSALRFAALSSSVASRITGSLLLGVALLAAAMLFWSDSLRA